MREVEVGWSVEEDGAAIADLLEFDGRPRWAAFEEEFIVAKEGGKVLAAVRVMAVPGRMSLWGFVADPRVREGEVAVGIYRGVCRLARELGIGEVWADDDRHGGSLLEAGYRRRIGGWKLDVTEERRERGLGRVFSLWARPAIPFFGRLGN